MKLRIFLVFRRCSRENGNSYTCRQRLKLRWPNSCWCQHLFIIFFLKVAKKREKQERKILDSQERAFWDVYRPPPGHVNTTEMDIKKMYKLSAIFGQEQSMVGTEKVELGPLQRQLSALQVCIPFIIINFNICLVVGFQIIMIPSVWWRWNIQVWNLINEMILETASLKLYNWGVGVKHWLNFQTQIIKTKKRRFSWNLSIFTFYFYSLLCSYLQSTVICQTYLYWSD